MSKRQNEAEAVEFGPPEPYVSPQRRLREQLLRPGFCLYAPGCYDGISGRIALKHGCDALYMSGACVTASKLGLPDLAFASQDDFVDRIAVLSALDPLVPVIADADTGFGGVNQIARTIKRYHHAGAAALHIEDQVAEKRCGHLAGKKIVSKLEFKGRIKAAVLARNSIAGGSDLVIIARTDAKQSFGLREAIERLKAAVEVGADCVFCEGIDKFDDYVSLVKEFPNTPVKASILYGGHAPKVTMEDFRRVGVKLVTLPGLPIDPVVSALDRAYAVAKATGSDVGTADQLRHPKEFFNLLGMQQYADFEDEVMKGLDE